MSRPGSLNGYVYVGNDAINLLDPSGLIPVGPGFIERALQSQSIYPYLLDGNRRERGPGKWLQAATELPIVREVYNYTRGRLLGGDFLNGSVTHLYSDVWLHAYLELSKAGFCKSKYHRLLESAHVSLVVLAKVSVVDRHDRRDVFPGGFANLPGYIPNPRATDNRDIQGADTATHFFSHAFLAFEMLYSDQYGPREQWYLMGPIQTAGDQIRSSIDFLGDIAGSKISMVDRWYKEYAGDYGFEDYRYWSQDNAAQRAYDYAVRSGDFYEVASTLGASTPEEMFNLWKTTEKEFKWYLDHSHPDARSGVQDVGVFRDLRANRRGANFGVTAFYQPTTFPVSDPPYIAPPLR